MKMSIIKKEQNEWKLMYESGIIIVLIMIIIIIVIEAAVQLTSIQPK